MNKLWNNTFSEAKKVLSAIEVNGYEAYFVGGCVRDFLLQRKIKDIDIASSALPAEIIDIFDTVIPVGIEHGTVIVRYAHQSYEVTTFRHEEQYSNQRHPDEVNFIRNIEEDLKRRDFTMNALAMDKNGNIIDIFDGKGDIKQKVICSVGAARERFLEDPLRMVRGIRFASQLGFQIEVSTYKEIINLKSEIEMVAMERITEELTKMFQGDFVEKGIKHLIETGIYMHIPVWKEYPHILTKMPASLPAFNSLSEVITLFHYIDDSIPITTWVRKWKCSNKTKKLSQQLSRGIKTYRLDGLTKWLLYQLPQEEQTSFVHLVDLLEGQSVNKDVLKLYNELEINNRSQLNINGHDLQQLFPHLPQGRWIEQCLEKIEYEIVMSHLPNTKNDIKEWILCHPPEVN